MYVDIYIIFIDCISSFFDNMGNNILTLQHRIDQLGIQIDALKNINTNQHINQPINPSVNQPINPSVNSCDEQGYETDSRINSIPDESQSIDSPINDKHKGVIIKCYKCNKTFKYKSRLAAHLRRKKPCDFILEIKDIDEVNKAKDENRFCKFCNRIFASTKYLKTHILKNCPIAPNVKNGNKGTEILYKHNILDNIVFDNDVDNYITINIHGTENLDFITDDDITQIYDSVLTIKMNKNIKEGDVRSLNYAVDTILCKLLILVYNNQLHPENFNMFIPSLDDFILSNDKKIMTYNKNGWSLEDSTLVYYKINESIIYNLLVLKRPRGPDYNIISKQIFKIKEIPESIIIPVIENIKKLLDCINYHPTLHII